MNHAVAVDASVAVKCVVLEPELRSPADVRAVALARTARLSSVYDALYIALAQLEGVVLWTADAQLVRELGTHAPWVKPLATYRVS